MKKMIFHGGILLLLCAIFLCSFDWLSVFFANNQRRMEVEGVLGKMLPAEEYIEVDFSPDTPNAGYVLNVYEAYNENRELTGKIVQVSGDLSYSEKYIWLAFSPDGGMLLYASVHNTDGSAVDSIPAVFRQSIYHVRLPIATDLDVMAMQQAAKPVLEGLIDGVYRSDGEKDKKSGYTDFVEMKVQNGWIVEVTWDAEHPEELNRAAASISGEWENVEGEIEWAMQAYAMEQKLLEIQDPTKIPVSSDGTTEIVRGVTTEISEFVRLSLLCVEKAKSGDKTEELPFSSEDPAAKPWQNSSSQMTPAPNGSNERNILIGGEDGVIFESDEENGRIYGFPVENIQTIVQASTDYYEEEKSLLQAVNRCYLFLQNLMNES